MQDQLCGKFNWAFGLPHSHERDAPEKAEKPFLPPAFPHIAANCVDSRQPTSAIGIGVNKNAYSLAIKLREQRLCSGQVNDFAVRKGEFCPSEGESAFFLASDQRN